MTNQSVSCLIFDKEKQKFVLIKRRDIPVWVLPGGGIDEGESPEEAAVREAFEETGLKVKISRKIAKYYPANRLTKITHHFECQVIEGELQTGPETAAIDYFSSDSIPKRMPSFYIDWIEDGLKNHPEIIEKKIEKTSYWTFVKYLLMHPITVIRFVLSRMGIHINH